MSIRALTPRFALSGGTVQLTGWFHWLTERRFSASALRSDHDVNSNDVMHPRICVVGSGPAGFYTVDKILKRMKGAQVDILEQLPTPYGLVRSGVAPDHPDTKNVIHHFEQILRHPNVRFLGNVGLDGNLVSIDDLTNLYDAVVLACGAEDGKRLHVPGSHLKHIFSAREFVHWYNGHPSGSHLNVDLSEVTSVAISGLGNVALDCARILLKEPKELQQTDITSHAYAVLSNSRVRRVHIFARRGPAQAACTPKELRELLGLPGVATQIHPENALSLETLCQEELQKSRIHRRVVETLSKARTEAEEVGNGEQKSIVFHFLSEPKEYHGTKSVTGLTLSKTKLVPIKRDDGSVYQKAVISDERYHMDCQLAIESVGYKGCAVPGVPFNHTTGTVPNSLGRIESQSTYHVYPGLFVTGWLKRGPSGIIGTNLLDAEQTVDTMVRSMGEWFPSISTGSKLGREGLLGILTEKGRRPVGLREWEKIDSAEVQRGAMHGKPREKIVNIQEMLDIAYAEH